MRWKKSAWILILFLILGLVVYAPSLAGPFQFDDKRVIEDPKIRERETVGGFLLASVLPGKADPLLGRGPVGTRSLVHATFLVDWKLWREKTWPYHVENVIIHVFASFLVFVLIGQILQMARGTWRVENETTSYKLRATRYFWLSVFGGLVFLLHPVQTQAVAYISQRFESVAAMLYLAAVVLYLRRSYAGAWLAGLAAMSSKETAITLPIALVMVEVWVIRRRFNWRQGLILGAFFLLAMKIPLQVVMSADLGGQVPTVAQIVDQAKAVEKQEAGMTRWTYLLTQFNVMRTYIRLMLVPVRQSIDYDYPLQMGWDAKTIASLTGLVSLVAISILAWKKGNRLATLAIGWFFITLAPTSSVIPIRDLIYEHRLYLSLVSFVLVLVSLIYKFNERYRQQMIIGGAVLLMIYSGLTLARSAVWANELRLWEDAWRKAPNKSRTNKNYGFLLGEEGRLKEARVRLERAIELESDNQDYFITLGAVYLKAQEWDKARTTFERATELRPDKADGWNNLGVALFQLKKYQESKRAFEVALEKEPEFYMAWLGLGGAEIVLGNLEAAQVALNRAVEIDPKAPETYRNLAILEKIKSSLGK